MKNLFLLLILFNTILLTTSYSQNSGSGMPTDLSLGYGALHGGLGGKLTLNNVVYVGLGALTGKTLWEAGLQFPFRINEMRNSGKLINTGYLAVGYGGIGVKTDFYWDSYGNFETATKAINGWTLLAGYLFVIGSDDRLFLDLGAGYSFGKTKFFEGTDFETDVKFNAYTIDGGIGYRF